RAVNGSAANGQIANAKDVVNGGKKPNNGGMSLRVGIGGSSSSSETRFTETGNNASTVYSQNGDVSVVAREGDGAAVGSRIEGVNTTVAARANLFLLSAEQGNEIKECNKASSGEIGRDLWVGSGHRHLRQCVDGQGPG
ncbi:MAG TPA: hemagglutinin repeat-containing protein, partial [Stenotrophomonas sp.]|nr:hemagglutinin repeat-containing protein [Stenotrophomonas sp.]